MVICNENKLEVKQGIESFTNDEVYKKILRSNGVLGAELVRQKQEKRNKCVEI